MLKVDKIEFWWNDKVYTINKNQIQDFPLIGGTAANIITTKVWNQHGNTWVDSYMEAQDENLTFILYTAFKNSNQIEEMRKECTDICNPLNGKVRMKVYLNSGSIYNRDIVFTTAPSFAVGADNRNQAWQKVLLQFEANNPFWYSEEEIVESFQAVEPLFSFPFNMTGQTDKAFGDYVNKTTGNLTTNPNLFRYRQATALATAITDFTTEVSQSHYDAVEAIGGTTSTWGTTTNLNIPQMLWSFDVIKILEAKYTTAIWGGLTALSDKVAKAKTMITKIIYDYRGYGTNSAGSSVTLNRWRSDTNTWYGNWTYNNTVVTQHLISSLTPSNNIDANGMIHLMANTAASNGTVASNLITDYVHLELQLTADYKTDPIYFGAILPNNVAVNTGQVPAPVTIRIEGACINPRIGKIINDVEVAFIKFNNLTLTAKDVLEIQTAFGEKGVWLNGVSIFNKLDFSSDFFNLDVGPNEISFTDDTGSTAAAIHFIYKNLYVTV